MNLSNCYQLLGLTSEAKLEEIKTSYRQLARQYHPDVNPGNQEAQAKFIQVTEAYKVLLKAMVNIEERVASQPSESSSTASRTCVTTVQRKTPPQTKIPELSAVEKQLKWNSYWLLQDLLKEKHFVRAIALVDGLAQRLPNDPEVKQWQAIAYQQRGRQLIQTGELDKARIYLKKALRTDPHNRSLWSEVKRDFHRLEQVFK